MDAFFHAAEHLARPHRHVVDGHVSLMGQVGVGKQQVGHQVNDVPAGEVRSCLFSEGFGKAADKVFKDVTAVHSTDLVGTEVSLRTVELPDRQIEGVALNHALDNVIKVKLGEHILNVRGESGKVIPEVGFNVLRVGEQFVKGESAGVVKLVAGCLL